MKGRIALSALAVVTAISCAEEVPSHYPAAEECTSSNPGDLVTRSDKIEIEGVVYDAEYSFLTVLEDRDRPDGLRIHLPVLRVRSRSTAPGDPVFLLEGGPGQTNVPFAPPAWILENHDAVMVGYRGIDGSVSLDCPEVGSALVIDRPLAPEGLERIGKAFRSGYDRLIAQGVDVDRYTMLDVIEDLEVARRALGYERLQLYSESYGTRVAYLYGLRYPESVQRSLMVGVNPPGHFVWEPGAVDGLIRTYEDLWRASAGADAPALADLMRRVLATMPAKWLMFDIDPDKVRCMTFMMLYHRASAVQVIETYVAADGGDHAGLALLSFFYDQMIGGAVNWGDNVSKAMSADYDPDRDYATDMNPPGGIIGSPFSQLFGFMHHDAWPMAPIPDEYRQLSKSAVPTLMVNGNLDASTPSIFAESELLPYLENGELVVLANMGHVNDVLSLQPDAFRHLASTFMADGTVDDTLFVPETIDFAPEETFGGMARRMLWLAVGVLVGALLVVAILVWVLVKLRRRRRARASLMAVQAS